MTIHGLCCARLLHRAVCRPAVTMAAAAAPTAAAAARAIYTVTLHAMHVRPPAPRRGEEHPAPAIVALHGLLGSHANFGAVLRGLARERGCHAHGVDLRGHGRSPCARPLTLDALAADVLAYCVEQQQQAAEEAEEADVLAHCAEQQQQAVAATACRAPVLMGHSLGGKVAMHAALRAGREAVGGLVVVDVAPRAYDVTGSAEPDSIVVGRGHGRGCAWVL